MSERDRTDRELEAFFAAAREHPPAAPEALLRRVMADADRLNGPAPAARPGLWARLTAALGGWQAVGGLAAAAAAGLWIGYAGIADPNALSGGYLGFDAAETVELMPGAEVFALLTDGEG